MKYFSNFLIIAAILIVSTIPFGASAFAQEGTTIPAPPSVSAVDHNGVDLIAGTLNYSQTDVNIGIPGQGGLSFTRYFYSTGWSHNLVSGVSIAGGTATVSLAGSSEKFTQISGVYESDKGNGATLVYNNSIYKYVYTRRDGTVAYFDTALANGYWPTSNTAMISSMVMPNGEEWFWNYDYLPSNYPGTMFARPGVRVKYVRSSLGYMLYLKYRSNNSTDWDWTQLSSVTAVNLAHPSCNLLAAGNFLADCIDNVTLNWPKATYGVPNANFIGYANTSVTDALGRTTNYTFSGLRLTSIKLPGEASPGMTITYGSNSKVASITYNNSKETTGDGTGLKYDYTFSVAGNVQTTTVVKTPSNSSLLPQARTTTIDVAAGTITTDVDPENRSIAYEYDTKKRVTKVTMPSGRYVVYAYDPRGNVESVTQHGGGGTLKVEADYPDTCTNFKTCNKPTWVKDGVGNQTNFVYDSNHGGVTQVISPPIMNVSPTVVYGYTTLTGTVGGGSYSVVKLSTVSRCTIAATCADTINELRTTMGYAASGNRLLTTVSSGSGAQPSMAVTTTSYDDIGNVLTVDGPLSGANDTVRYRYDRVRQVTAVISPDPDSSGPLLPKAIRITYDNNGQVTSRAVGTVTSQTDADWSSFSASQDSVSSYDAAGRKVWDALIAGGTKYALNQYSYDAANRTKCIATRMTQSSFNSLPTTACTLTTAGEDGAYDRITQTDYDKTDLPKDVREALGTSGLLGSQALTISRTYNNDKQLEDVYDANSNRTQLTYDVFGRIKRIYYQNPTAVAGTLSATDYDEFNYDNASRITSFRKRSDPILYSITYDQLGRVKTADGRSYVYDYAGRLTSVSGGGYSVAYTYNALGHRLTEVTSSGSSSWTVTSEYDMVGRRTKLIWPDGFYVTYDYDQAGNLKNVREYGATAGAGVLASFSYDSLGRRTGIIWGNGVVTSYGYDAISQLNSLVHNPSGTAQDQNTSFTRNRAGQISSRISSNETYTRSTPSKVDRSYQIDRLNRVSSITNFKTGANTTITPSYDPYSNLSNDGVVSFSYDTAGRMVSGNGATMTYDALSRLTQINKTTQTRFLYDGVRIIAEYNASTGAVVSRYVHGVGTDEPIVWYQGSGTGDRRSLLRDERGSVVAVTNGSGVASLNTYDEYGQPGTANQGRFQYTGQTWLSEVGVYHYKSRAYSPTLGRFLQPDPISYAGGMNLYAYVGGDPVNKIDPNGWVEFCYDSGIQFGSYDPNTGGFSVTAVRPFCSNFDFNSGYYQIDNFVNSFSFTYAPSKDDWFTASLDNGGGNACTPPAITIFGQVNGSDVVGMGPVGAVGMYAEVDAEGFVHEFGGFTNYGFGLFYDVSLNLTVGAVKGGAENLQGRAFTVGGGYANAGAGMIWGAAGSDTLSNLIGGYASASASPALISLSFTVSKTDLYPIAQLTKSGNPTASGGKRTGC